MILMIFKKEDKVKGTSENEEKGGIKVILFS